MTTMINEQMVEQTIDNTLKNLVGLFIVIGLAAVITIITFWILNNIFAKYSMKAKNDIPKEKKTSMRMLYSILRFAVILIMILCVLSILGVNVSGAVAGLGIAGAIGGLAIQDLLKDLIQGINIASGAFFSIGDVIEYEGTKMKVVEITMRNTKAISIGDGSVRTIGNRLIQEANKCSDMITVEIPLAYEADTKYVYETLGKIAKEAEQQDNNITDCTFKGINSFGDSAINYLFVLHCKEPDKCFAAKRDMLKLLQYRLEEAKLDIPYDQLVVRNE